MSRPFSISSRAKPARTQGPALHSEGKTAALVVGAASRRGGFSEQRAEPSKPETRNPKRGTRNSDLIFSPRNTRTERSDIGQNTKGRSCPRMARMNANIDLGIRNPESVTRNPEPVNLDPFPGSVSEPSAQSAVNWIGYGTALTYDSLRPQILRGPRAFSKIAPRLAVAGD